MPSYRDMTAPQLVVHWKKIVNDNINMGRDAKMLKEFLEVATPVQILLGMYQFEDEHNVTIPMFIRTQNTWLELDPETADIELATLISRKIPPDYYVWKELRQEQDADSWYLYNQARIAIREWADRILS